MEDTDKEVVVGHALIGPIVVTLVGQMDVLHLVGGFVETIDTLEERILERRHARCPVAAIIELGACLTVGVVGIDRKGRP